MKKILFWLIILPALFVLSCTKTPVEQDKTPTETPFDDTIEGTVKFTTEPKYTVSGLGEKKNLVFTVDCNWKITLPDNVDWISVSPDHGNASTSRQTAAMEIAANPEAKSRRATLTFHAGATQQKISVTQEGNVATISKEDVPDLDKIYIPQEFSGMDMFRSDSKWYFGRSKQSEHFIVFWELGYDPYGEKTPSDLATNNAYYVDIDDLLEKAEEFYRVNIDVLKFADTGKGKSNLDKYKMEIYILHQTEWLATGSGYDNTIGALWINPATCHPVGSTIAHEIGHSFQYMVYADALANGAANDFSTGFRYEIGQGCGFWEQCAQWQAYQSYADQAFSTVNFSEFVNNSHRHFTHEHQRYASYFLQWHWASKHGVAEIGEIWRGARKPEDPIQAYQRMHGLSMDELNADLYDYAARCVTWDFSAEATNLDEGKLTGVTQPVREFGKNYIGKIGWTGNYDNASGFYTVDYSRAPEATGFNHIRINIPADGKVSVRFEGLPNATGFNRVSDPSIAGWNVGFVSLMKDGSRVYSESTRVRDNADIDYTVPEGTEKLWLVVAATPETYLQHLWDEDNTNDEQWPFRVKFTGTDLYGNISFDGTETPKSIELEHDITTSAAAGYAGPSFELGDDVFDIARAFVMKPSDIVSALGEFSGVRTSAVKLLAVKPDGTLDTSYTTKDPDAYYSANGFGFWFAADGTVTTWGGAHTFMEYNPSTWSCQFGVHPDKVKSGDIKPGDTYTVAFAFVKGDYNATVKFNITITD